MYIYMYIYVYVPMPYTILSVIILSIFLLHASMTSFGQLVWPGERMHL